MDGASVDGDIADGDCVDGLVVGLFDRGFGLMKEGEKVFGLGLMKEGENVFLGLRVGDSEGVCCTSIE